MRRFMGLSVVVVFLSAGVGRVEEGKAEAFFDKELSGWEGIKDLWSVKDGAIVGYTQKDPGFNTFLVSKKTYKDFEMTFDVRLKDGVGNSGVQIRSKMIDKKKERFTVHGPQVDVGKGYWGSLYNEGKGMMRASSKESQKAVKEKEFNKYSIRAVGKKVTIKVNGETTVDEEFKDLPEEGIIAFQLHAGYKTMEVTFKDVVFKEIK